MHLFVTHCGIYIVKTSDILKFTNYLYSSPDELNLNVNFDILKEHLNIDLEVLCNQVKKETV